MTTLRLWFTCMVLALCVLASGTALAGCLDQRRLLGVNLAGGEFGHEKLPGIVNRDYVYPSREDLVYFKSLGMNIVRVPFRWERIQRQINAPLDIAEVEHLRRVVRTAQSLGICVLLDLHNYGGYHKRVLGTADLPAAAFVDVWVRLYESFPDADAAAFGLMNEPAALPVPKWIDIAQQTVLALRAAGAKNLVMVGSGRWSGAHEWQTPFDGVSGATAFSKFRDPLNNFAVELHQYADANYSGTGPGCIEADRLRAVMARITTWAKQQNRRFFLGEFGVGASPECLAALQGLLEAMQDADAWLGWSYWAAGPWWGSYPFSIQPGKSAEAPQLAVIRKFLAK